MRLVTLDSREVGGRPVAWGLSGLVSCDENFEPVEFARQLYLAHEAACWTPLDGRVQHGVLHLFQGLKARQPGLGDIGVAGGAGAGPTALCQDSGDTVVESALHDRIASRHVGFDTLAVNIVKNHSGHEHP